MSNDDNFEPYWLDEQDCLVTVCPLPKDEDGPEGNLVGIPVKVNIDSGRKPNGIPERR